MIKEDYVSFEVAKLLKEKGFNCETDMYYSPEGELKCWFPNGLKSWLDNKGNETWWWKCVAPTLQMAMKWLRKSHNIHIEIARGPKGYHINIVTIPLGVVKYITRDIVKTTYVDSYEEACEATIKYCLKNFLV